MKWIPNPCPKCGSQLWYRKQFNRYYSREYCGKCHRWKRTYTERDDKENVPSHCGKCKWFEETVFEGETANGWGSWYGYCIAPIRERGETMSRFYGCDFGEKEEKGGTK